MSPGSEVAFPAMDILLLLLRVLHVGLGAFWFGAVMFNTVFLGPALNEIGPDAAKVGAAMIRQKVMVYMPIAAITTILSGLWLYWRISGGFQPEFMGSRQGMTLGTGGLAAIVAVVLGLAIIKPAMEKAGALGQKAGQSSGAERDALLAQAAAARGRSASGSIAVALLLVVAILAMAVARYV